MTVKKRAFSGEFDAENVYLGLQKLRTSLDKVVQDEDKNLDCGHEFLVAFAVKILLIGDSSCRNLAKDIFVLYLQLVARGSQNGRVAQGIVSFG